MASVTIDSGGFPLMRNINYSRQPERSKVYNEWSKAFHYDVPGAVEHLADVIEDVYSFELWKDKYLETPEQFFAQLGLLDLDLDEPAKLIKELRKKRSTKRAQIIARAQKAKELREQGKTQQQIADELGVTQRTVSTDLEENRVITPKTSKPRKVIGYRITEYTKPETAAQKLIDTFGDKWCSELVKELIGKT
jgi:predicted transcriptional regulator